MAVVVEDTVEQACLEWLQELGYTPVFGPDIAPDGEQAERPDYKSVILEGRLQAALSRINPGLPLDVLEQAIKEIQRIEKPDLIETNRAFQKLLTEGILVETRRPDGSSSHIPVMLVDYENLDANEWLAINQFTVEHGNKTKRPDVVIFINGLPLAVIELKNAANETTTIHKAYTQLQNYKNDVSPCLIPTACWSFPMALRRVWAPYPQTLNASCHGER